MISSLYETELQRTRSLMLDLPWEETKFYASYLTQTYHFVAHSTRLLALASGFARAGDDRLHRRYASHIHEEKGHDQLAINDLRNLGISVLGRAQPATLNLFETQYYKVMFVHPTVLNAYILALEGVASNICPAVLHREVEAHGANTARFLKLHVDEDPDHVSTALRELEAAPPEYAGDIQINLQQSFENYRHFLGAIAKGCSTEHGLNRLNQPSNLATQI